MKVILQERGLWKDKLQKKCSEKSGGCNTGSVNCCASTILSNQEDFKLQRERVEELIISHEHKCIFYSRYYCELNYIEMYWRLRKHITRKQCDYK